MAFATLFDSLYCPEEHLDLYREPEEVEERGVVLDEDLAVLFGAMRSKEVAAAVEGEEDGYCGAAGREAAVGWAARAVARLGFSALTAALAAAYLDRCFLGGALRLRGRPWMARLAAVACVALAAKVEETRVPLLLDLQLCAAAAGDGDASEAYVFEAKTVRRMELLVLSALGWRMHPVTPLSYLHPLLGGGAAASRLLRCESALLAVMADWRWPGHRPSAWAAAVLLATADRDDDGDDDAELLALIDAPKDEVGECYKIVAEATDAGGGGYNNNGNKRKRGALHSPPVSPSGVIFACFSCESSSSSGDSRVTWPSSVPSSPEPARLNKRAAAAQLFPPDEESRDAW